MNNENIWLQVKEVLKTKLDQTVFNETFNDVNDIHKIQNNYIYIIVPSPLIKFRIQKFYLKEMDEILNEKLDGKHGFILITKQEADEENEKAKIPIFTTPDVSETIRVRNMRPEYTFENFVTGEANREAFTIALKVAADPRHVTVNPLYIFGDVGLGKTHLMTAIGHYILSNDINKNIVFTTAQQFVEDFFNAKNKNQKNPEASKIFNHYYRSADVLLIDDIQFLVGKSGSQEEFFKLFEDLFENGKQIVITSDRPANELDIMGRLKSRFNWGIPVDIKKPSVELRESILKKKLEFLISTPEEIGEEILEYIASNFDQNVRELEGALRRFITYCVSFNYDFTIEHAKDVLQSIISKEKNIETDVTNSVCSEKVKTVVSSYYNISIKDLYSSSRKQELVYARNIAIYLLRHVYNLPLKKIGEAIGGKDHATISHSLDKIKTAVLKDSSVKQDIDFLKGKLVDKK